MDTTQNDRDAHLRIARNWLAQNHEGRIMALVEDGSIAQSLQVVLGEVDRLSAEHERERNRGNAAVAMLAQAVEERDAASAEVEKLRAAADDDAKALAQAHAFLDREMTANEKLRAELEALRASEWLVVRAREQDPIEVWRFEKDEQQARAFFDAAALQWSETFLVRVVAGPGNPPPSIPLHPLQAEATRLAMANKEQTALVEQCRPVVSLVQSFQRATDRYNRLYEMEKPDQTMYMQAGEEMEKLRERLQEMPLPTLPEVKP